jgi:cytochrome c peroxidase
MPGVSCGSAEPLRVIGVEESRSKPDAVAARVEKRHDPTKGDALGRSVVDRLILVFGYAYAQQTERGQSSYMPVDITQSFAQIMARMTAAKPGIERDHMALLTERYDLSDRPAQGATMDRGKPLQEGVRVKLPAGMTWERLAAMSPEQIRDQNLFPKGFYPLPHPNHIDGGFVFPHFEIDAIKHRTAET